MAASVEQITAELKFSRQFGAKNLRAPVSQVNNPTMASYQGDRRTADSENTEECKFYKPTKAR